ncbi:hypothetical protein Ssi03_73300 [Sphaerisporangium siamense]|uniref:Uncharacterized protein n=1 Tax=Sphaerisporangium siamense TaxID=795645 RepID=A0A7W7D6Z9_9ACTN|nr:hypothetical protein [Sphaerisporangium siamense]MBB4701119.1 hypothetical protein [Sphaerisporangium siamense]GII89340.1 hypothetical protein Ssi03_73300 [Sphaerisporangium siamense]
MWKRGLNWAAVTLVAVFGLLWLGVVVFAATSTSGWLRIVQAVFSVSLVGWAIRKSTLLIRATT